MATPRLAPPAPPHGPIIEVFPDVFQVEGGFRFGPGLSIGRNMTILRQDGELVLVNSVRLSPERERELDALGKVKHVLRIGEFHGIDDRYYVERYAPTYWAPPNIRRDGQPSPDRELTPSATPLTGSSVFRFEKGQGVEVALIVERHGGVLVTCDSYQNWTSFSGCSFFGGLMMRAMGFQPEHIGVPWTKRMGPGVRADFDRLLEQPFAHLAPGHGSVLRDRAKDGLRAAIRKRFPG